MQPAHSPGIPIFKTAPAVRLVIPFAFGIVLARYATLSPGLLGLLFAILLALMVFFHLQAKRYPLGFGWSFAFAGMVMGMLLYHYNRKEHQAEFAGTHYHSGAWITAHTETYGEARPKSWRVEARISQWDSTTGKWVKLNGNIIIYLERTEGMVPPVPGMAIAFRKPLEPILSGGNPGGFDYKRYAADHGLFFQVFLGPNEYVAKQIKNPWWAYLPQHMRHGLLHTLRTYIPEGETLGVAEALLTGYRGDMDKSLSLAYAGTGAAHIIAISGMHLGMLQVAFFALLKPVSRLRYGTGMRAGATIVLLWVFTFITGAGPSVLRAAVMFTILLFGQVIGRKGNKYNSLAFSAFLLLLFNPNVLFDTGFQLSYSAVLSIFMFSAPITRLVQSGNPLIHAAWQAVAVTLAAQVLTLPFVIYYFNQFPVYFLLANLIAIPLSWLALHLSLALTLGCWWFPPVATLLGKGIHYTLLAMNAGIRFVDTLPLSRIDHIYMPLYQAISVMIILLLAANWLQYFRPRAAVAAFTGLCALIVVRETEWHLRHTRNTLVVYNIPRTLAIDYFYGHNAVFTGDSICITDPLMYHRYIRPARIQFQTTASVIQPLPDKGFLKMHLPGCNLLLLHQEPLLSDTLNISADILLVSGNIKTNPAHILQHIPCKTVVVAATVPFYQARRWQSAADSLHLQHHAVARAGAFVYPLPGSK